MAELLRMEKITRSFPGLIANDCIDAEVQEGEILALLGENGAGKTTLMNCLYGLLRPDSGTFYWKGEAVEINHIKDAVELGIGMVHQHFMLIPVMTVVENVSLGVPSTKGMLLDLDVVEERLGKICEEYGFEVDPSSVIMQLPVGVQQRVEILKALYRDIQLLILDEPTAVLTPAEVEGLFRILRRLAADGMSIILITHKLEEVMAVCDRVTILRDGKVIGTVDVEETSKKELAHMMVGRDVVFDVEKPELKQGEVMLSVEDLTVPGDRGIPALTGINFELHEGEILGIAGVDGNGQSELEDVICGLRYPSCGKINLSGMDVTGKKPAELMDMGLSHIASDRLDRGIAIDMSVEENLVGAYITRKPYSRRGILNHGAIRDYTSRCIREFNIQTIKPETKIGNLSGGNQQRAVLASALSNNPKVILAAQPTRGLDVGVTQQVYERLIEERNKGTAILLISTELQEIFRLSDRIAVLYRGACMGIVDTKDTTVHDIGMMMAGIDPASQREEMNRER